MLPTNNFAMSCTIRQAVVWQSRKKSREERDESDECVYIYCHTGKDLHTFALPGLFNLSLMSMLPHDHALDGVTTGAPVLSRTTLEKEVEKEAEM